MVALGALLVTAGALVAGCGSGQPASPPATTSSPAPAGTSYVGTVAGSNAFVSVVVDGSRAMAYVCDGVPGADIGSAVPPTVQVWFNGTSDGKSVDVSQPQGRLQLQLTGDTLSGTFTRAGGAPAAVTGQLVTGEAGLYRAEASGNGVSVLAGWILAASGEQRGGAGLEGGGGVGLEGGGGLGVPQLKTTQLQFNFRNLASSRIAKVGITPIPIP
jgi:hypothetical protein